MGIPTIERLLKNLKMVLNEGSILVVNLINLEELQILTDFALIEVRVQVVKLKY